MSIRLKEVVFKVKCRWPGCPYVDDVSVKDNIMGLTEADVDSEAWKIARGVSYNKHDAIHGNFHPLTDPSIVKVSGTYDRLGPTLAIGPEQPSKSLLDPAALERRVHELEAAYASLKEKVRAGARRLVKKAAKTLAKRPEKKPAKTPVAKKPVAKKPAVKKPAKRPANKAPKKPTAKKVAKKRRR
jgi:hypothetical protein